tara:strand:- start:2043 stop:2399 length:357 start_codon:yes stop_codon:yes gene_type:complete
MYAFVHVAQDHVQTIVLMVRDTTDRTASGGSTDQCILRETNAHTARLPCHAKKWIRNKLNTADPCRHYLNATPDANESTLGEAAQAASNDVFESPESPSATHEMRYRGQSRSHFDWRD